jgi:MYXO-CTERM domain-containing protein
MTRTIALLAVAGLACDAGADVLINEVQGSTSGSDWEFIELYNSGGVAIDIGDWQVELWDSDEGNVGGADGAAPYVIPGGSMIPAGGYFLLANMLASDGYAVIADLALPANAIENSSYTIILADGPLLGSIILDSILVVDGDADDLDNANRAGDAITPGAIFGPDGDFLPGGLYRVGDGSPNLALLEFDVPSPSATPGAANIPAPASLTLLGLGAIFARRRR